MTAPDRAWLEAHAHLTLAAAGREWGCSEQQMQRIYATSGVKRTYRRTSPGSELKYDAPDEWLRERAHLPAQDIADELGCDKSTVRNIYRRHGIRHEPSVTRRTGSWECERCKARPLCRLLERTGADLPCMTGGLIDDCDPPLEATG